MLDKKTLQMAKSDALQLLRLLLEYDRSSLYDVLHRIKFDLLSIEAAEESKKNSTTH